MGKIALDIDGVIAELGSVLKNALAREGKTVDEKKYPWVEEDYFIKNPDIYLEAEPVEGSIEGIKKLQKDNDVIFITRRPKEAKAHTEKWLTMQGIDNPVVVHTNDKGKTAKKLNVSFAVDDGPEDILSYMAQNIPVLVMPKAYNEHLIDKAPVFYW